MTFSVNLQDWTVCSVSTLDIIKRERKSADVGERTLWVNQAEISHTLYICANSANLTCFFCRCRSIMQNKLPKYFRLSGVISIILTLISDNVVQTDANFKSHPTTVKTYENDSVLLPCYAKGSWCCSRVNQVKMIYKLSSFPQHQHAKC